LSEVLLTAVGRTRSVRGRQRWVAASRGAWNPRSRRRLVAHLTAGARTLRAAGWCVHSYQGFPPSDDRDGSPSRLWRGSVHSAPPTSATQGLRALLVENLFPTTTLTALRCSWCWWVRPCASRRWPPRSASCHRLPGVGHPCRSSGDPVPIATTGQPANTV